MRLKVDSRPIDVLSPVPGEVVELNRAALRKPELDWHRPVRRRLADEGARPRLRLGANHLLTNGLARRWMHDVSGELRGLLSPELGRVYQDGGIPVRGMAREIDPERWESIARRFLLTEPSVSQSDVPSR